MQTKIRAHMDITAYDVTKRVHSDLVHIDAMMPMTV